MSLINEMLRNLEAKRPDDLARQNLQREIRTLPSPPPTRWRVLKLLLLSGLPLLGGAAAVLHGNGQLLPLLGLAPLPEAPAVAAPPVPAQPAPLPVAIEPPPATPEPMPAVDMQPEPISAGLRPAHALTILPSVAVPDPLAAPIAKPAPAAPAFTPAPVSVQPEAGRPVAPQSSGPVKIEKSPVLATPRDRAEAEYRRAENAQVAGHGGEAQEALVAALKHDPTYFQVRQALLRQLLDTHKFTEAISVLNDGLEIQPAQIGWAMSLARLQLEQGDLAAADRTLARSQHHAEANADYAGFQGHLKSRQGAHRQAASHYQRATRLAPHEGRWWLGLGLALEADARPLEAKDALKRALATSNLSNELAAVAEQHLR